MKNLLSKISCQTPFKQCRFIQSCADFLFCFWEHAYESSFFIFWVHLSSADPFLVIYFKRCKRNAWAVLLCWVKYCTVTSYVQTHIENIARFRAWIGLPGCEVGGEDGVGTVLAPERITTETCSTFKHQKNGRMEFLDINLTKGSSLLLHAIHSPFYWRIWKKTNHHKKIRETRNSSLFMDSIFCRTEKWE